MGSFFSRSSRGGYERPRSSNWLTILGDRNIAALGGRDVIARGVTPDTKILEHRGGITIRAGHLPTLGDPANGGIPEAYREVSRIIRPIRFEDYKFGVIKVPTGLDGRAETLNWLRRFD